MSWTEIIVLSICLAVPLAVISLFAIYKKNKNKIAEKKAKENVKPKTDEEKELEALKNKSNLKKNTKRKENFKLRINQVVHMVLVAVMMTNWTNC